MLTDVLHALHDAGLLLVDPGSFGVAGSGWVWVARITATVKLATALIGLAITLMVPVRRFRRARRIRSRRSGRRS